MGSKCEYENCSNNAVKTVTIYDNSNTLTNFLCQTHANHVEQIHDADDTSVASRNMPRNINYMQDGTV